MLKKRYNTKAVVVIMTIIALCIMGALYLIRNAYGYSRVYSIAIFAMVGIIMIIYALSITRWREVDIIEQPCDYPPIGLNPLQTGCIVSGEVNNRDIISGFYYLAQKGYMTIREYELKRFEFTAIEFPKNEHDDIKMIYRAIFGAEGVDKPGTVVKLCDASDRLIDVVPRISQSTVKSIRHKRNKEIADLTGKVRGFRSSLIANKGDKAQALLEKDPDYIFEILPYAYEFAITAKIASNFAIDKMAAPSWYIPFGVDDDYIFDVLIYNSMLRNMPEELRLLVFDEIGIRQRIGM